MKDKIIVFADGASKGNPGRGGWGAIVVSPDGTVQELGAAAPTATNNQMELQAVIAGLEFAQSKAGAIVVLTDSSYVIQGVESWVGRWQRNGWRTVNGDEVRNRDLWMRLSELASTLRLENRAPTWQHVRGHAGIPGNERVDRIAHYFAVGEPLKLYEGPLSAYDVDPYVWKAQGDAPEKAKRSRQAAYSYLSLINGQLVIHKSWADCEARVKGQKGARFKKTLNAEEEKLTIAQWTGSHA